MENILVAPSIRRRICVGLYEMLMLLGVWALGYLVPSLALGVMLEIQVPPWLAFGHVYLLFGLYFVWYWTNTGQTLAMQTWRVKMVNLSGKDLNRSQALIRFAIGSLWLIPAVIIYGAYKLLLGYPMGNWPTLELLFVMALFFWPLTCLLDQNNQLGKQSLADRLAKTRLIQLPKSPIDEVNPSA